MGRIKPLELEYGGWKVTRDMGLVQINSINNVSGNFQSKHQVEVECPKCLTRVVRNLGNIKSSLRKGQSLRCTHCVETNYMYGQGRLQRAYVAMIKRCYNPEARSFSSHGALGVTVCEAWLKDEHTFYSWALSHGYTESLYLDRRDNYQGYTPENCRWVTPSASALNRELFQSSSTGYRHINPYKNPRSSKHRFQVRVQGYRVGYFDTLGEAIQARNNYYTKKGIIANDTKRF